MHRRLSQRWLEARRPIGMALVLLATTGYSSCDDLFTRPIVFGGNLPTSRNSSTSSSSSGSGGDSSLFPADDDGDGLSNEVELAFGLDSKSADSDHDGFADGLEFVGRSGDPSNSRLTPISSTRSRIVEGTPIAGTDSDGDGVPDALERQLGTDLNSPDTDADGYSDGLELISGSDPKSSTSRPVREAALVPDGLTRTGNPPNDRDGDGLSDDIEGQLTTRTDAKDTDFDGYPDWVEYIMGSDPADRGNIPDFTIPVTQETSVFQ